MTISNRELNDRLTNLQDCAREAPDGTYERAKEAAQCLDDCAESIFAIFKQYRFNLKGMDGFRDLEAALFGLMLDANPHEYQLATAEGFGAAMNGPERRRVISQTERDRDALRAIGAIQ